MMKKEAAKEKKTLTYKENPIRLSLDFSAETLELRIEWNQISNYWKIEITSQEQYIQQCYPLDIEEK